MATGTDDAARRAYWTEQMEAGHAFMEVMKAYPVEECGEPMAPLAQAAEQAGIEVRFSINKVAGGFDRIFWLREGLMDDFVSAAREMNGRGWVLKVEDAYRTRDIQRGLACVPSIFDTILKRVIWEGGGQTPSPEQLFRRITALVATCPKIGTHMSGSALDISVLRTDGSGVDRGGPYVELSERTPMGSPFVSEEARRNRDSITATMANHGFVAYPYEFWHYSQGDAYGEHMNTSGKPARYGAVDLDLRTGRTTAIENPTNSLHSTEEIRQRIREALERTGGAH